MNTIAVLPTYKEAVNLKILIPQLLKIKNLSIIIIDDNSPDETKKVAEKFSRVTLFQRKERGRATAGILGFKKALEKKPGFIIEMDADLSHRPEDVKKMLSNINKYDVVIGSRFVKGGQDQREGILRHLLSQISRKIYKLITGLNIEDIGSGFKCYKSDVIKKLLEKPFFSEAGTSICLEINFKLVKLGFKTHEIPIKFIDRIHGESKVTWKSFIDPIVVAFKLVKTYGRI